MGVRYGKERFSQVGKDVPDGQNVFPNLEKLFYSVWKHFPDWKKRSPGWGGIFPSFWWDNLAEAKELKVDSTRSWVKGSFPDDYTEKKLRNLKGTKQGTKLPGMDPHGAGG